MNVSQIQSFILGLDQAQQRPWQLWIGNEQITQPDGSNPRIKQLNLNTVTTFMVAGFTDKNTLYSIRIVQSERLKPLMDPTLKWYLSFDGGDTKFPVTVVEIRESITQSAYWTVTVAK